MMKMNSRAAVAAVLGMLVVSTTASSFLLNEGADFGEDSMYGTAVSGRPSNGNGMSGIDKADFPENGTERRRSNAVGSRSDLQDRYGLSNDALETLTKWTNFRPTAKPRRATKAQRVAAGRLQDVRARQ